MAPLIYLASPYSHPNPAVRELRYELARIVTANWLKNGEAMFSPIVYGKSMEKMIGTDYKSWKNFNDAMLTACTSLMVLKLDGWDISKGVQYEIALAKQLGKPVNYLQPPEISR
jgi:hypothetical protein